MTNIITQIIIIIIILQTQTITLIDDTIVNALYETQDQAREIAS